MFQHKSVPETLLHYVDTVTLASYWNQSTGVHHEALTSFVCIDVNTAGACCSVASHLVASSKEGVEGDRSLHSSSRIKLSV